mmetsp:Transcript_78795/g.219021  ORF Transcript_78795/g.219021 Transcript_78795/m.219021 type:complete len:380 (-) Transcript_78795:103-1242(-)
MESDAGPAQKHPQQLFFDNVSPETRLLEKRRQMYEVQDALENQKARFAKDEERFRQREEQLREKDLQLQHQLFRFNKFLQDNEAKRRRAETRACEEATQIKSKEEEIRDLEKQLDVSRQQCAELAEEVARNMKYEVFLEHVRNTSDDFQEISDLVTRYDTLESANRYLMELQTASENMIEELRNKFQSYRKEQEMQMLADTNRIASLSTDLDEARKQRQELEHQVEEATLMDSGQSLHFGQILMSVENLFRRCTTKRKGIHHDDEILKGREGEEADEAENSFKRKQQNSVRELKVILAYIKDFKDMVETLRKERRSDPKGKLGQADQEKTREPEITIETIEPRAGDRNSHNSGSQGNTKDLSKNVRDTTSGSGGVVDAP